jgi:predicted double-glycine peptidase
MTILDGVPHVKQSTPYSCGPACATIILKYYGYKAREKAMIKRLKADPEEGIRPEVLVKFFRDKKFKIKQKHNMDMSELEKLLDKGWPVIVAYQDHSESATNYHTSWDHGHYAVIMGYDSERIYMVDPSSLKKKKGLLKEDFVGRWRDITTKGDQYHAWGMAIGAKK